GIEILRQRMERACLFDRRSLSKLEPINRCALLAKFSFELRHRKKGVVCRLRHNLKLHLSATYPFDLMKVIGLISRDTQDTVWLQRNRDCIQKVGRENPSDLMPPLRPRVRKQEIKGFY